MRGLCGGRPFTRFDHAMCSKRRGVDLYKRRRMAPVRPEPRRLCLAVQAHCKNLPSDHGQLAGISKPILEAAGPFFYKSKVWRDLAVRSTADHAQALSLARAGLCAKMAHSQSKHTILSQTSASLAQLCFDLTERHNTREALSRSRLRR